MYHDLIRDAARGFGPALTPVNAPLHRRIRRCVVHKAIGSAISRGLTFFRPIVRPRERSTPAACSRPVPSVAGASAGVILPYGEVSS